MLLAPLPAQTYLFSFPFYSLLLLLILLCISPESTDQGWGQRKEKA